MISCLTVTQESRLGSLNLALSDFLRQTERDRELVIVHDGTDAFHERLSAMAGTDPGSRIRVVRVPSSPRLTLGALGNASLAAARGEYICQWDDDDRYHPRRFEIQMEALRAAGSDACVLVDQLHFFVESREMYWDDWHD